MQMALLAAFFGHDEIREARRFVDSLTCQSADQIYTFTSVAARLVGAWHLGSRTKINMFHHITVCPGLCSGQCDRVLSINSRGILLVFKCLSAQADLHQQYFRLLHNIKILRLIVLSANNIWCIVVEWRVSF